MPHAGSSSARTRWKVTETKSTSRWRRITSSIASKILILPSQLSSTRLKCATQPPRPNTIRMVNALAHHLTRVISAISARKVSWLIKLTTRRIVYQRSILTPWSAMASVLTINIKKRVSANRHTPVTSVSFATMMISSTPTASVSIWLPIWRAYPSTGGKT